MIDGTMSDENTPLLNPDTNESPFHYRSRWRSIRVLYFTIFLSAVGFSIVMPSVWPFLKILDPAAQTTLLGLVIGSFSLGQLAASPVVGALVNAFGNTGPPLMICLFVQILGNLMWSQLEDLPHANGYFMLFSRILIGTGAANMAAIRAYVSKATTLRERTKANAFVSTCQALGFIIGPGLQAAMVPLGYPGSINLRGFRINVYTTPGWLGALFGVVNFMAIMSVFREHSIEDEPDLRRIDIQSSITEHAEQFPRDILEAENVNESITPSTSSASEVQTVNVDYFVITILLIVFFFVLFNFVLFETIMTPLSMYEYGWSKTQTTLYMGITWAATGVVTICVVLLVSGPLQRLGERLLLLVGFGITFCGFIVYFPLAGPTPPIDWINGTHGNFSLHAAMASDGGGDGRGCPSNLEWCFELPQIHLTQMLFALLLLSIGYPTTNLLTSTLYSKVLGSKPQGIWMGFFTASGSLARMFGPVYVGAIFERAGPLATLGSGAGFAGLGFLLVAVTYRRIIPYAERKRIIEESRQSQQC